MNYEEKCIRCNDSTLFEYFHNETSLSLKDKHVFDRSISEAFDNNLFLNELLNVKKRKFKNNKNKINLDNFMEDIEIEKIFSKRKSCRVFKNQIIDIGIFSGIFKMGYSMNSDNRITIPSAGGLYPIKLMVIVNNISEIDSGIYEYDPINCSLYPLSKMFAMQDYKKITSSGTLTENAAFSIHFLGDPRLTCYKYQDRGYRFLNIECGHIAQNISLASTYLNVGSICSGGFLDGQFIDFLDSKLGIDYSPYLYLYEMFFGYESEVHSTV